MSNIITDAAHDVKVAAVDTAHVAEKVFGDIPKVIAVLGSALKDEPKVKAAVVGLVQEFATLSADAAAVVAGHGVDIVADAATVSAAEGLYAYMKDTFVPAIEALYGDIKADIAGSVTP